MLAHKISPCTLRPSSIEMANEDICFGELVLFVPIAEMSPRVPSRAGSFFLFRSPLNRSTDLQPGCYRLKVMNEKVRRYSMGNVFSPSSTEESSIIADPPLLIIHAKPSPSTVDFGRRAIRPASPIQCPNLDRQRLDVTISAIRRKLVEARFQP